MNIIAIGNQKGGTAKTTTAAALGVLLSRAGLRTHLVDADPQASLSTAFGQFDSHGLLYQALCQRASLPVVSLSDNLSLSPSSIDLSRGETNFISEPGREYLLQTCLQRSGLPDSTTVILDCPPSLGILSIACLTAAQHLLVVVQPGGFELRTLVHLDETVQILRERVNPRLTVMGAILTNCHPRRVITEEVCGGRPALAGPWAGPGRRPASLCHYGGKGVLLESLKGIGGLSGDHSGTLTGSMSKNPVVGISGVLGGLITPAQPIGHSPPKTDPIRGETIESVTLEGEEFQCLRSHARLGRPPGRTSPSLSQKEKVTLRISARLIAEYRDWSWQRRCQLGELVEAALQAYRKQHVARG